MKPCRSDRRVATRQRPPVGAEAPATPTATGHAPDGASGANRPSNGHVDSGKAGRVYDAITGELVAVVAVVPGLKLKNPLNGSHRHWRGPARERKRVRELVAAALLAHVGRVCPLAFPLVVTVTRVAPSGGLDEWDGLPASTKPAVDETASWLGLRNDRDPRVRWVPAQRRGAPKFYAVEIRIERAESCVTSG